MILNAIGALWLVIGLAAAFAVGGLVDVIWPRADQGGRAGALTFFVLPLLLDVIFRWRSFRDRGRVRFVHPFLGGMIFFIPVWIAFALFPPVMVVLDLLDKPQKGPVRKSEATPPARERPTPKEQSWITAPSGTPA